MKAKKALKAKKAPKAGKAEQRFLRNLINRAVMKKKSVPRHVRDGGDVTAASFEVLFPLGTRGKFSLCVQLDDHKWVEQQDSSTTVTVTNASDKLKKPVKREVVGQMNTTKKSCDGLKCGKHGSCFEGKCLCVEGFSGRNCEVAPAPIPKKAIRTEVKLSLPADKARELNDPNSATMKELIKTMAESAGVDPQRIIIRATQSITPEQAQFQHQEQIANALSKDQKIPGTFVATPAPLPGTPVAPKAPAAGPVEAGPKAPRVQKNFLQTESSTMINGAAGMFPTVGGGGQFLEVASRAQVDAASEAAWNYYGKSKTYTGDDARVIQPHKPQQASTLTMDEALKEERMAEAALHKDEGAGMVVTGQTVTTSATAQSYTALGADESPKEVTITMDINPSSSSSVDPKQALKNLQTVSTSDSKNSPMKSSPMGKYVNGVSSVCQDGMPPGPNGCQREPWCGFSFLGLDCTWSIAIVSIMCIFAVAATVLVLYCYVCKEKPALDPNFTPLRPTHNNNNNNNEQQDVEYNTNLVDSDHHAHIRDEYNDDYSAHGEYDQFESMSHPLQRGRVAPSHF